jgi:hypothetical protein
MTFNLYTFLIPKNKDRQLFAKDIIKILLDSKRTKSQMKVKLKELAQIYDRPETSVYETFRIMKRKKLVVYINREGYRLDLTFLSEMYEEMGKNISEEQIKISEEKNQLLREWNIIHERNEAIDSLMKLINQTNYDSYKEKEREDKKKLEKKVIWQKNYSEKNKESILARAAKRYQNIQKQIFNIIISRGGKCERCGYSDIRALEIHHINRDGSKGYLKRYKEIIEGKVKVDILCANCHMIDQRPRKVIKLSSEDSVKLLSIESS